MYFNEKEVEQIKGFELAHDEFYFFVKILKAKNKELDIVDEKYYKGNVIRLPLYIYGRPIIASND
jgi:hypothetical protein